MAPTSNSAPAPRDFEKDPYPNMEDKFAGITMVFDSAARGAGSNMLWAYPDYSPNSAKPASRPGRNPFLKFALPKRALR